MTERELPTRDLGIDAGQESEHVFSNVSMPPSVNGSLVDLNQDGFADTAQLAIDPTNGGRIGIQTEIIRGHAGSVINFCEYRDAARARLAA